MEYAGPFGLHVVSAVPEGPRDQKVSPARCSYNKGSNGRNRRGWSVGRGFPSVMHFLPKLSCQDATCGETEMKTRFTAVEHRLQKRQTQDLEVLMKVTGTVIVGVLPSSLTVLVAGWGLGGKSGRAL